MIRPDRFLLGRWRSGRGFRTHYLGGLYHRTSDNHLFLFAGGLAFATLLCLVPSAFLIFFVLEAILDEDSMAHLVGMAVDLFIPYQGEAAHLKDALASRVPGVVQFKENYGVFGLLILVLSVSSLFSSMRTLLNRVFKAENKHREYLKARRLGVRQILNRVFQAESEHRAQVWTALRRSGRKVLGGEVAGVLRAIVGTFPVFLDKLRDMVTVVLVMSTFLLLVFALPVLAAFIDAVLFPLRSYAYITYLYSFSSLALIFAVFLSLYWLVPYRQPPLRILALGALWAALLWKLAAWVFGYYLSHFPSIGYLYGAYVLSAAIALWIYFAAIVFIIGAEIAQLYHEKHSDRS